MPPLRGHAVRDIVDVEGGTAHRDDADERLAYDLEIRGETGVSAHGISDGARSAHNLVCRSDVARLADTHQTRPTSCNQGARAGSRHVRGGVDAARPVRRDEVLVGAQFRGAVEDGAVPLWRESILVGVAGDGGDTAEAEVEEWGGEAGGGEEGNEEGAEAAVDVERDAARDSELGEPGDVVDDAVGEVGCRADEEDCVAVNKARDGGDGDLVGGSGAGDEVDLDPKVVAGFVEGGMRCVGEDPGRGVSTFVGPRAGEWVAYISGSVTPRST